MNTTGLPSLCGYLPRAAAGGVSSAGAAGSGGGGGGGGGYGDDGGSVRGIIHPYFDPEVRPNDRGNGGPTFDLRSSSILVSWAKELLSSALLLSTKACHSA